MKVNLEHSRGNQPLYVQLANAIENHIVTEAVQPGERLPSESALAADNDLSRATIMKAYEILEDRGRITRRQGKGTFVRARPMERMLPDFNSFSDHVQSLGLAPSSRLLSFQTVAPGADDRPETALDDDLELVVMERLRSVDGNPVGLQRVALPRYVATKVGLDEAVAAKPDFSFYDTLRDHGVELSTGEESLRAINADTTDAALLDVPEGTALIEVVRQSRDGSGVLVESVRARYLGSKYLYQVTLAQSNGGIHENRDNQAADRPGGRVSAAAFGVLV